MAKKRNYAVEAFHIATQLSWEGGRGQPTLLIGSPGNGKTRIHQLIAAANAKELVRRGIKKDEDTAYHFFNLVTTQASPETLEGIAALYEDERGNKSLRRYPLEDIRKLQQSGYGMVLGDEITSAQVATGGAMMTFVQDGRAGDETVPHTVHRSLACNPPETAAGGRDLSFPEANRVLHLRWKMPLDDFLDYARGGPGLMRHLVWLPQGWEEKHVPTARALVAGFLSSNPKLQNTLDSGVTTDANEGEAWASERSWEGLWRLLGACFSIGEEPSSQLCYTMVEGMVGTGVAKAFMSYIREFDLPSPEVVLKEALKPDTTDERIRNTVPDSVWARPDKTRLLLESVAVYANQAPDEVRGALWLAAMRVLEPILDKAPDNAMSAAKILVDSKPAGVPVPPAAVKLFKAREKAGLLRTTKK